MDRGICSICAGERVVHGKPCLCEDGTTIGELHGIRMECFRLDAALSSLQAKHDRVVAAAKEMRDSFHGSQVRNHQAEAWHKLNDALADEVTDERGGEG